MIINRIVRNIFIFIILLLTGFQVLSQVSLNTGINSIDYSDPKEYEIGGITISGIKYLDHNALIHLSGLSVGDKIFVPGSEITQAIKKLWKQGLFSDVKISATKVMGDIIFLDIFLKERPRLSKFSFTGVTKSEADDIRERIKLVRGSQITDNIINNTIVRIRNYYIDKGFLNTEVKINQENDTVFVNNVILRIHVNKKKKIKINEIDIQGNDILSDRKLRRSMKDTKQKTWYNIFKASKYIEDNYKEDKSKLIDKYYEKGFRDAEIISDTVYVYDNKTINIDIKVSEGSKYYFRNITWVGNTKYTSTSLSKILGIKKGDVFNQSILDEKIFMDPAGVWSLYQDEGYLFSSITPVEVMAENDSIDIEMRIIEGKQANIGRVTISGNTKTNEHVIRREIRTKPGQLYSRSDIIRTHRELAQLGYFDPEKLDVTPIPNPAEGTVDLEYIVEERPSDQIELSGGWGAGMIVGTLGLTLNNFSARNMFRSKAWRPIPTGDGQRLSIRAQTNGTYYQAYNISFVEPWLGGKKPNALSVSLFHTIQTTGTWIAQEVTSSMKISGISTGLQTRLKWPDDYFILSGDVSYQYYDLNNWSYFSLYQNGTSNNFSFSGTFARNSSGPSPLFPTQGSLFSLTLQVTPPYSLFTDKDYSTLDPQDKYRWIEYHKWTYKAQWFTSIDKGNKLVLHTRAQGGFLGLYNRGLGPSPFEGFEVGGDGLTGYYNLYGRDNISLRGYENRSLTPEDGGNIYNKYTFELRYPVSLNPNATIYGLAFLEAGNAWFEFREFNPFDIKRSAGFGVRVFLPMFGLLGVDWGYGFDEVYYKNGNPKPGVNGGNFHFVIGQQF